MRDKIILILVLICIILLFVSFYLYNLYKHTISDLNTLSLVMTQNEEYYNDMLKQKEDSIVTLSGKVENLNKGSSRLKKEYTLQIQHLKALVDSFSTTKETTPLVDSVYVEVPFSGKKYIVNYYGFTRYFFQNKKGEYYIYVDFDPIYLRSRFFIDDKGVWKMVTESLTPGIKVNVDYYIDSTFFVQKTLSKKEPILKLRAYLQGVFKNNLNYEAGVDIYYKHFYTGYDFLQKQIKAGIFWDFNIK